MAVLSPADSTEANTAVVLQSLASIGAKSSVSSQTELNTLTTKISLGEIGAKTSVVLIDGLIDFTIINPADSYRISEE